MKVKRIKANAERQLLIAMVMSDSFLKRIYPIIKLDYFDTKVTATIGKWILDYFKEYTIAPKSFIKNLYEDNKTMLPPENQEWIEEFLDGLSKEYEKKGFNEGYVFKKSLRFFKRQGLRKNIIKIEKLLDKDKVEEAEELWIKSRTIPESFDLGFEPLSEHSVDEVFRKEEVRVKAKTGIEALDLLLLPIKSGWFVLFMGPQKRGKTWTLIWIAINLIVQGFNVTFLSFEGEDEDWAFRAWMSIGSYVLEGEERKLRFPYFKDKRGTEVKYEERKRPYLTASRMKKELRKFNNLARGRLILKSFPMGSAGMREAERYVEALEAYKGYSADVYIFDYIGVMSAPYDDRKEKYNWIGMRMKAFAHNKNAIVLSGHQGRRETLEKLNMGVIDIPEDVRLLGHVDILCGINQTEEERDMGIMRYSTLIHRHRKYISSRQAKILQQLSSGQVALDSRIAQAPIPSDFKKDKDFEEEPYQ